MIWHRITLILTAFIFLTVSGSNITQAQSTARPEGWNDYSHSNSTDPVYDIVFPQDNVNTITINITPDTWQLLLEDMTGLYGEFGTSRGMRGGFEFPGASQLPGGFEFPGGFDLPEGFEPPDGFEMPSNFDFPGQTGGLLGSNTENPIWVTVDLEFNEQTWTNVGFRFKGNSSLMSTWGSGSYKLPFRLNFDKFEDDYLEIDNQRFYGFQQLSFTNHFNDDSLLRERVSSDVFRESGIPTAHTAFYAVYVDYGEGPIYFGLYTSVELVDDTVIETQFSDSSGNLYKPEGEGANFVEGSFNEESFSKETNANTADYSDILALFDALHAETRISDPVVWREDLEAVFNTNGFMHWLAVNTVIQNWDTYGSMAHNYYLYNDPATGQLTWIPWDLDLSMQSGMGGFGGGMGRGGGMGEFGNNAAFDQAGIGDNWPLIRYLMDDPVYHDLYVLYIEQTINDTFEPTQMEERFQRLHDLIAPYVEAEIEGYSNLSSLEAFENSITELVNHVNQRNVLAEEYLSMQAGESSD